MFELRFNVATNVVLIRPLVDANLATDVEMLVH